MASQPTNFASLTKDREYPRVSKEAGSGATVDHEPLIELSEEEGVAEGQQEERGVEGQQVPRFIKPRRYE